MIRVNNILDEIDYAVSGYNLKNVDATLNLDTSIKALVLVKTEKSFLEELYLKFYLCLKRIFDIVASLCALILLSPVFLIIAVAIKVDSKGSVFYKHKRVGKDGKHIYLYKFRSMYIDSKERLEKLLKDPKIKKEWEANYKLNNDPRITQVGEILRKTSLDELPQLLNILNGDMSIVGPRPVIDEELQKYGYNKSKFLSAIPGLTGFWAANGRSNTTYDERMKMELFYVDNRCISLDIKIIFQTVISVLKRKGAK